MTEQVVATLEINNWIINEGVEPEVVPVENTSRTIKVIDGRGWGGVSLVSQEPFGEAEIHLELDDRGLHLLVYVPGTGGGEPALNAFIRPNGLVVAALAAVDEVSA